MNILIAYFSYTEHTRGIANQVQSLAGGDLFEIRPAEAYSADYDTTERQARKETHDGYHPPLAEQVKDLVPYHEANGKNRDCREEKRVREDRGKVC